MKNLKLVLMLGLMFMVTMGVVSAATVDFVSPVMGEYTSGDDYVVEWENGDFEVGWLKYKTGFCDGTASGEILVSSITAEGTYSLDTLEKIPDGDYCLKITGTDSIFGFVNFSVDNTAPKADFTFTGKVIYETVSFDGTSSTDTGGSGIETYEWNFDNGETGTGSTDNTGFDEVKTYSVSLTVTDYAGNSDTITKDVKITDLPIEDDIFEYEAGILGITGAPTLSESFDTELGGTVTCEVLPIYAEIINIDVSETGTSCTIDESSDIPYSERGVHEIIIKATYGTEVKYYSVTISVYTWWMPLTEGWNMISIPMMPEDTAIESVLANIYDGIADEDYTIFQYDAAYGSSGRWYRAKKDGEGEFEVTSSPSRELEDIFPGYGYSINMKEEAILKGFGNIAPEINGPFMTVDIANGWNFIGHYGLADLGIHQALSSLRVGPNNRYYDSVVTSTGDMKPYKGYWMTAKFIPDGETGYTPSQSAINSVFI
jgi:hypothetical protein